MLLIDEIRGDYLLSDLDHRMSDSLKMNESKWMGLNVQLHNISKELKK